MASGHSEKSRDTSGLANCHGGLFRFVFTTNTGICRVLAISKIEDNDRYGTTIRVKFKRVHTALSNVYGVGKSIDFLTAR